MTNVIKDSALGYNVGSSVEVKIKTCEDFPWSFIENLCHAMGRFSFGSHDDFRSIIHTTHRNFSSFQLISTGKPRDMSGHRFLPEYRRLLVTPTVITQDAGPRLNFSDSVCHGNSFHKTIRPAFHNHSQGNIKRKVWDLT